MRAYCGGSWRCQEDAEEEREVGGVEKKKSSLLKTLNQFEKKLGPNPTCLSEEANKVRKKNTKCPLSEKLYIYIKKHTI